MNEQCDRWSPPLFVPPAGQGRGLDEARHDALMALRRGRGLSRREQAQLAVLRHYLGRRPLADLPDVKGSPATYREYGEKS